MLNIVYCVGYIYLYTILLKRKQKNYILAYARRKNTSRTIVYVVTILLLEFIINISFKLLGLDPHAVNLHNSKRTSVHVACSNLYMHIKKN